ncbi:hypothetical protein M2202_009526 [Bradyrhizobium japonicum]|nr:hypothetical protein [Bradyrhizobium japonicum]MCP1768999.1 hypothetical protein [Bradyrhizobium japonicum]MCP1784703.1 hypothetical protein [Bradyrhizobium japonicum]MCP1794818.1 hypothetical protein [Bradyrhizobium japonicum]MCP1810743.1 hypothetical protein [Bradyrhizobium japonicum]
MSFDEPGRASRFRPHRSRQPFSKYPTLAL